MRLFTVAEAAKTLGLHPSRVRVFCQTGRLGRKVGSQYVIPAKDLARFKRRHRPNGRPRGKTK